MGLDILDWMARHYHGVEVFVLVTGSLAIIGVLLKGLGDTIAALDTVVKQYRARGKSRQSP